MAIRELKTDFRRLKRNHGLVDAADPVDTIKHMGPDELRDLTTLMYQSLLRCSAEAVSSDEDEDDGNGANSPISREQQSHNIVIPAGHPHPQQQQQLPSVGPPTAGGARAPTTTAHGEAPPPPLTHWGQPISKGVGADRTPSVETSQELSPLKQRGLRGSPGLVEVIATDGSKLYLPDTSGGSHDLPTSPASRSGGSGGLMSEMFKPVTLSFEGASSSSSSDDDGRDKANSSANDMMSRSGSQGSQTGLPRSGSGGHVKKEKIVEELKLSRSARTAVSVDGFDMINDYTLLDQIGKGQCGRVMLAIKEGENTTKAIKIVPRQKLAKKLNAMSPRCSPRGSPQDRGLRLSPKKSPQHSSLSTNGIAATHGDQKPVFLQQLEGLDNDVELDTPKNHRTASPRSLPASPKCVRSEVPPFATTAISSQGQQSSPDPLPGARSNNTNDGESARTRNTGTNFSFSSVAGGLTEAETESSRTMPIIADDGSNTNTPLTLGQPLATTQQQETKPPMSAGRPPNLELTEFNLLSPTKGRDPDNNFEGDGPSTTGVRGLVELESPESGTGNQSKTRDGAVVSPKPMLDVLLSDGSEVDLDVLAREVAVMKRLSKHKNIVTLYEVIDDEAEGFIYLVMQYCDQGPIFNLKSDGTCDKMDPEKVKRYFQQILRGLYYLERNGVLHLDIKPDNILLHSDDCVYLADFGMSEMMEPPIKVEGFTEQHGLMVPGVYHLPLTPHGQAPFSPNAMGSSLMSRSLSQLPGSTPRASHQQRGTPAFMSPEMCQGDEERIAAATDIWSLGVTLYCMLLGELPFKGRWMEMTRNILEKEANIPTTLPQHWQDILKGMLNKNPEERVSLTWLRLHPFLATGASVGGRRRRESRARSTSRSASPGPGRSWAMTPTGDGGVLTPRDLSMEPLSNPELENALTAVSHRRHHRIALSPLQNRLPSSTAAGVQSPSMSGTSRPPLSPHSGSVTLDRSPGFGSSYGNLLSPMSTPQSTYRLPGSMTGQVAPIGSSTGGGSVLNSSLTGSRTGGSTRLMPVASHGMKSIGTESSITPQHPPLSPNSNPSFGSISHHSEMEGSTNSLDIATPSGSMTQHLPLPGGSGANPQPVQAPIRSATSSHSLRPRMTHDEPQQPGLQRAQSTLSPGASLTAPPSNISSHQTSLQATPRHSVSHEGEKQSAMPTILAPRLLTQPGNQRGQQPPQATTDAWAVTTSESPPKGASQNPDGGPGLSSSRLHLESLNLQLNDSSNPASPNNATVAHQVVTSPRRSWVDSEKSKGEL